MPHLILGDGPLPHELLNFEAFVFTLALAALGVLILGVLPYVGLRLIRSGLRDLRAGKRVPAEIATTRPVYFYARIARGVGLIVLAAGALDTIQYNIDVLFRAGAPGMGWPGHGLALVLAGILIIAVALVVQYRTQAPRAEERSRDLGSFLARRITAADDAPPTSSSG